MEIEKSKINQKVEETQKIQLTKEELLELKAKEAMRMAESLLADLKVQQTEIKQPARKVKREKIPSESSDGEVEIPIEKDKTKRVSKKISKKQKKVDKKEETEEDSFIAGDITETEKSEDEKEYRDSDFDEKSEDEPIYDPLQNSHKNGDFERPKLKQETRKLRKKHEFVRKEVAKAKSDIEDEVDKNLESPSVSEDSEHENKNKPNIKDVNEDIYITKHRTNKKFLMDEEDE